MASRVAERESLSTAVRPIAQESASPAETLFLLIVDGDSWVRDLCKEVAGGMGFKVSTADSARVALREMELRPVDLVMLDVRQSAPEGLDLLARFKEIHPRTEIIMIGGQGTVDSVVTAMKNGAWDFIRKPFKAEDLKALLTRAASRLRDSMEDRMAHGQLAIAPGYNGLLGLSSEMQKLYRTIAKVAPTRHAVLIQGESGTGKESVARAIHNDGPFRDRPFLQVDCASPAPGALESELFAPSKSLAASAKGRDGIFALASGGTLFFDEIAEMPLEIQSLLVRVLQDREFHPVGAPKSVPVDVRVIASTSRDLDLAVQQGTFRRDLFFRLNVVGLRLPPLRERKEDIRLLAEHFLEQLSPEHQAAYSIHHNVMKALQSYDWPGNVRELENCLEQAVAISSGPILQPADFPVHIRTAALRAVVPGKQVRILPLAELEKQAILEALQQLNGDKLMTARALGIGKTTLYRKLKEYGIALWAGVSTPGPL